MHFAPQPLVTTCHVPLRNPYAPRSQGEPCQSGRRADDDDGGDDGDDSHRGDYGGDEGDGAAATMTTATNASMVTALTDDGTAAAEQGSVRKFQHAENGSRLARRPEGEFVTAVLWARCRGTVQGPFENAGQCPDGPPVDGD